MAFFLAVENMSKNTLSSLKTNEVRYDFSSRYSIDRADVYSFNEQSACEVLTCKYYNKK